MKISVNRILPDKSFEIIGLSYIGRPRSNTAMYITKKVEYLLHALENVDSCLVFAETGMEIPDTISEKHGFQFSGRPQQAYAAFANLFEKERFIEENAIPIHFKDGYYISETATIGNGAYIEPDCFIGPGVVIGDNARLLKGTVIRHAVIGDCFYSNEYAVIGSNGFTMTEDDEGSKIRIPTLGRVLIGHNVEIGAHDNISCGSGGDTIIEDNVKIDALVHIGHDDHIFKNVEIAAGTVLGGFVNIGESVFIGINSSVRNRTDVGDSTFVSMGASVMKSVANNQTVIGYPARPLPKK